MYIYNVTIKPLWEIHDAWFAWMKDIHVPQVMATGCFTHYQFTRLLEVEEDDGPTYAIQYYCSTKELYNKYINQFAPALRQDGVDKFGNKFIGFRSLMQIVH